MSAPTQKEQVLSMLKAAGSWGLRSDVFLQHRIPRAAARIGELRQEGYEITSEHERQFVRYVLVAEPPRADAGVGSRGRRAPREMGTLRPAVDSGVVGSGAGSSPADEGDSGTHAAPPASVASGESPQPAHVPGEASPALFELPTERPSVPSAYDPYSEAA